MKVVIPPRKNRKIQRKYDKNIYKVRKLVENAFLHLKRWRSIATRYCKICLHSLLLFKSDAWLSGEMSRDDIM